MVNPGISPLGFIPKTYTEIVEELKTQARSLFGNDVDLSDTSTIYKIIQVMAYSSAQVWSQAESVYNSGFVDTASDMSLERVGALVGINRLTASYAVVTVTFTGTPATSVPAGTVVLTGDGTEFETDTIDVVGGGGTVDIACTAMIPGADGNVAISTIDELETPISGITGVDNAAAAISGEDAESDEDLRYRIKNAVKGAQTGSLEAIENAILEVAGVTSVLITENTTTHSAACTVFGVTSPNEDIDQAILDTRPVGIAVTWAAATTVAIDVIATIAIDDDTAPTDADDQLEDAIESYTETLDPGEDVIFDKFYQYIYNTGDWVEDVTALTVNTGTANISISTTQIAIVGSTTVTTT